MLLHIKDAYHLHLCEEPPVGQTVRLAQLRSYPRDKIHVEVALVFNRHPSAVITNEIFFHKLIGGPRDIDFPRLS